MKSVIGIGNALTDVLINLANDDVLGSFKLPKGSMSLVDSAFQRRLSEKTADLPKALSLGGSAANTIRAMARLGVKTGFIGKVGVDKTGDFFEKALENLQITPEILRGREHSGMCISLISPDGERTMATHLGAAQEMTAGEIKMDVFSGFDCLYIEGYLVQDHDLIRGAAIMAKKCGLRIAIDLASFNIVEENIMFLRELVRDYVDIVFANEDEAAVFSGNRNPEEAVGIISNDCKLAVVKIGTRGAYIKEYGEAMKHVGIMAAAKRVDTTGAGDFYSAGFLSGMCEGLSIEQCGTIGAIAAGKVIEVVGTTFGEEGWSDIFRLTERVKTEKYLF